MDIEEERTALIAEALLRDKGARNDYVILRLSVAVPGLPQVFRALFFPASGFSKSLRVHDSRSIPQGSIRSRAPTAKNGLA